MTKAGGEIDGDRRLAHPALLVQQTDDHLGVFRQDPERAANLPPPIRIDLLLGKKSHQIDKKTTLLGR
jgi:hypothetical protein